MKFVLTDRLRLAEPLIRYKREVTLMICPKCAKEIPNDLSFCPFCGLPIGEKSSRQQQSSEPQTKTVLTPTVQQYSAIQQSPTLLSQIPKVQVAQPFDKNMETVLRQQKKILHLNRFLTFLMVIIAVGIGYLAIAQFRQTHSSETLDSSNRVLAET